MKIQAYAAMGQGTGFVPFEYDPGELGPEEVEIQVEACGICHSDLSVWKNEWGNAEYPFVGGHEIAGIVSSVGSQVRHVKEGQRVGLGWFASSCMGCEHCLAGDHNLCVERKDLIIGHHGGFADRVRCHWAWAIPLPDGIDSRTAGPLFCGGITVFNPIIQNAVRPTDRVGVVGIGGLGHMALQFLDHWGCDVTAFTTSPGKSGEARKFGADRVVSSHDAAELEEIAGSLDMILVTSNATLQWDLYIQALRPRGRLHIVGAVLEPVPVNVFSLLMQQKSISATPLGSPQTMRRMLDFCAQHQIAPQVETFPMSRINEAFAHLEAGNARYRIVLTRDA
jgi:uncharacterized zinc-type alcohol dehydrogenase-like protein